MLCERAGVKHRGLAVHGDIEIVPEDTPCVWEPNGPDSALIVSLDRHLLDEAAADLGLHGKRPVLLNRFQFRDPQIEHICWALKAEMEAGYPTGRAFVNGLSRALAVALVQRHSSLSSPNLSFGRVSRDRLRLAISYIEDHLKYQLSLDEIARAAGVSVSLLKSTFRELIGVPVHQYVIQRRVARAAALLTSGKLSISHVAEEAGFAHQGHLAKHMQRVLGCSPKVVRQNGAPKPLKIYA